MAHVNKPTWVKKVLLSFWNIWPPFLGAGIKIKILSPDLRHVEAKLKLRFWNKNFFGTQYGGSLFSMTDALYSVMLAENLGRNYIVWDRAATIRYLKPGRTDVRAVFKIDQEILNHIHKELETSERMHWHKTVHILDTQDQIIAEVDKVVYVKKKK